MGNNNNKELEFLTEEEIKERIKNHELWLRGNKNIEHSFGNLYIGEWSRGNGKEKEDFSISKYIFENQNLEKADFSNSELEYQCFYGTNLKEAIFTGVSLKNCRFFNTYSNNIINRDSEANLEGADFRLAIYDLSQFTKEQKSQIILTDSDYEKYQEKKKLEEKNKELEKSIENKNKKLKNTSDKQIDTLTSSFEKLEQDFKSEENQWLIISFEAFLSLLFLFSIPIFDIFLFEKIYYIIFWGILAIGGLIMVSVFLVLFDIDKNEKEKLTWKEDVINFIKKFWFPIIYLFIIILGINSFIDTIIKPQNSIFKLDSQYILLPMGILLASFLYFSVSQYSKAKKLRIENQNKIALLHGMIALKADTDEDMNKPFFYNNIADVVFSKVYQGKENNLPVDKILDIIKLVNKK